MPFDIAFFGSSLVSSYWNGAATYYRGIVRAMAARGHRVAFYNALDPATHFPEPADPRFRGCLGFLGNRLPDREARVEEFFLGPAVAHPAETFVVGGAGWEDKRMPAKVRRVGHVNTRDHNRFNASARAILNVNRESMARYGHSPATRLFEAAGAGACLITDAFAGIERFLEPDREVLIANDGSEVSRHLERLTPERARAMGAAARARVLTEHTYDHRAAEVEDVLNRLLSEDEAGDVDAATAGGCA